MLVVQLTLRLVVEPALILLLPVLLFRLLLLATATDSSTAGAAAIATAFDYSATVYSLKLRHSIEACGTW